MAVATTGEYHPEHLTELDTRYPDLESRRRMAAQMARSSLGLDRLVKLLPEPDKDCLHPLLAQWGSGPDVLRTLHNRIHKIRDIVRLYQDGDMAAVITKGSLEDILDSGKDCVSRDTEVVYGVPAKKNVVTSFLGSAIDEKQPYSGIKPPYLRFGQSLAFSSAYRVNLDREGFRTNTEVDPIYSVKGIEGKVTRVHFYSGVVPLEPEDGFYEVRRDQRPLVLDSEMLEQILLLLDKKTYMSTLLIA